MVMVHDEYRLHRSFKEFQSSGLVNNPGEDIVFNINQKDTTSLRLLEKMEMLPRNNTGYSI